MKKNNTLCFMLSAALFLCPVSAAVADDMETDGIMTSGYEESDENGDSSEEQTQNSFGSVTGTVKEIRNYVDDSGRETEGQYFLSIVSENDQESTLAITNRTFFVSGYEPEEGDTVIGFYDAKAPTIMIYPPQYQALVVAEQEKDRFIKFDIFDENLISSSQDLQLNIGDDTEIVNEEGEEFTGDLENRRLIVFYTVSTRSIPAQTTPEKIIVLYEEAVHPIYELSDEERENLGTSLPDETEEDFVVTPVEDEYVKGPKGTVLPKEIYINQELYPSLSAYIKDDTTVMVPIRGIAEALGFLVTWQEETQTVHIGENISIEIDSYVYMVNGEKNIDLAHAPTLVDDTTYVPLDFFKTIIEMPNAYQEMDRIIINNIPPEADIEESEELDSDPS